MHSIKPGVIFYGLKPEMGFCHSFIIEIFDDHSIPCIPTSVVGKKHGTYSLHPVGFAIDYRTKHIMGHRRIDTINQIADDIRTALPCCDVVVEHLGQEQEHIHVEFDPKDDELFQVHKKQYRETGVWPS